MPPVVLLVYLIVRSFSPPDSTGFDIQGHRGCRGLMPENTLPAFQKALDLGVTTLEMDVVVTRDNQVVVSHEPYFNADYSLGPDGSPVNKKEQKSLLLYQMDYATIRQYDVGSRGNAAYPEQEKIKAYKPLLSEVIHHLESYKKAKNLADFSYSIELKSNPSDYNKSQPEPAHFCNLVQTVLKNTVSNERIVIQSFDFNILQYWKQQIKAGTYPNCRLSALVENLRSPEKNIADLGFKPDIYSPHFRLVNKSKITRLHELAIKVIPWTVNQPSDIKRLKSWGVDGLITDYPNRLSSL